MKVIGNTAPQKHNFSAKVKGIIRLILKAVPLAMGIGVSALIILGEIDTSSALLLMGIGLACLSLNALSEGSK